MNRWVCGGAVVVCVLTTGPGCGSRSEPEKAPPEAQAPQAPAEPNAADVYSSLQDGLVKPANAALDNPGALNPLLAAHRDDIERAVEATRMRRCDFGVRYDDGLNAMMPHLGQVRALARVLKADAARMTAAGDAEGAGRRVAAILRLATQVAAGARSQIELLVACAVAQMGCDVVGATPGLGRTAAKTDVQQALAAMQAGGVLNSASIIREDAKLSASSVRSGRAPAGIKIMGKDLAACTPAEREAAAKKLETFGAEIAAAWDTPGASAAIAGIVRRAEAEGVGEVVGVPHKTRESVDRVKAAVPGAYAALAK